MLNDMNLFQNLSEDSNDLVNVSDLSDVHCYSCSCEN